MAKDGRGWVIGSRKWQLDAVESCLVNDENSTDEELVQYWISEIKLSEADAREFIKQRDSAFRDPINFHLST